MQIGPEATAPVKAAPPAHSRIVRADKVIRMPGVPARAPRPPSAPRLAPAPRPIKPVVEAAPTPRQRRLFVPIPRPKPPPATEKPAAVAKAPRTARPRPSRLFVPPAPKEEPRPVFVAPAPAPSVYPGAKGELQQSPILTGDLENGIGYETNMAAFEAQDPRGNRPSRANVGYASMKGMFRR